MPCLTPALGPQGRCFARVHPICSFGSLSELRTGWWSSLLPACMTGGMLGWVVPCAGKEANWGKAQDILLALAKANSGART